MSGMKLLRQAQQGMRWFLRRLDTHPLTVSAVTVTGFTATGLISWTLLEWIDDYRHGNDNNDELFHASGGKKMSLEEARLRAMIENAQESSWQENLDNAATAQERFMLPGRQSYHDAKPDFMAMIDKRSLEIMENQHAQVDETRKQQRKPTTQIWTG